MSSVNGCDIPADLFYNVESNVWARLEADGTVTVGMTAYACSLAGQIVAFTPKKVGKTVKLDKSCATVESGKWVGPVKAPVSGQIVATNALLIETPETINADPYGAGWVSRINPDDWGADSVGLLTGDAALREFAEKMEADGFGGC
jgi:glycine cleavage system H protein